MPCEACGKKLLEAYGYALCRTCWQAEEVCRREGVASLLELLDPSRSLLWRVSDVIRRSNVADAEVLVKRLETRIR